MAFISFLANALRKEINVNRKSFQLTGSQSDMRRVQKLKTFRQPQQQTRWCLLGDDKNAIVMGIGSQSLSWEIHRYNCAMLRSSIYIENVNSIAKRCPPTTYVGVFKTIVKRTTIHVTEQQWAPDSEFLSYFILIRLPQISSRGGFFINHTEKCFGNSF